MTVVSNMVVEIPCAPGCDCDRFVEVWNLVFSVLSKRMAVILYWNRKILIWHGSERLAAVMQGVGNIFEVDTIQNFEDCCRLLPNSYGTDQIKDISLRVIADHLRRP